MSQAPHSTSQPTATEKIEAQEAMDLYGSRPAITRISPRMVLMALLLVAAIGGLALIIGVGSNRRSATHGDEREVNLVRPSDQVVQSHVVGSLPSDYTFDVRDEFRDVGYENRHPQPATAPVASPSPEELAAERERRLRLDALREEWEKAIDSPVVFASAQRRISLVNAEHSSAAEASGTRTDSDSSGQSGLVAMNLSPGFASDPNTALPRDTRQNLQSEKERFLTDAGAVEPYLKKPLLQPLSRYELKAGTLIPGALLTAINTDLPGEVIAQVTENVYDTVSGHHLLIPQGSRLLGKYQSLISNGQNRALIVWTRLILPNGDSIVLDGMPGTDQLGQSGLRDRVDYHLDRVGTAVALSTAIAYGGNLARGDRRGRSDDAGDVIGDTIAQEASRVGQRFVDRELDVQPTITIRSGWPLRVLANKDMLLTPYRPE